MSAALRAGKISSRELVEEALRKIADLDGRLNSFLTVTGDLAKAQADALDRERAEGKDRGILHGIPIAHKDLVRTKGVRTTGGSKIFADYVPTRDAAVALVLTEAGVVSIGKTGLHELAYGITSDNPHYGAIHNPWDLARIPGGSSGGSAAAVAAGIVPFATGTDTGGSIRVPASFCGIVGFKPTFGKISTAGVFPLGETLDHVGPMTRTVRDAAIAYQAMAIQPSGYVPSSKVEMRGVRVGVPRNYYFEHVDAEIAASVKNAVAITERLGAQVVDIEVPDMMALTRAGATCLLAEAAAALRPYGDGSRCACDGRAHRIGGRDRLTASRVQRRRKRTRAIEQRRVGGQRRSAVRAAETHAAQIARDRAIVDIERGHREVEGRPGGCRGGRRDCQVCGHRLSEHPRRPQEGVVVAPTLDDGAAVGGERHRPALPGMAHPAGACQLVALLGPGAVGSRDYPDRAGAGVVAVAADYGSVPVAGEGHAAECRLAGRARADQSGALLGPDAVGAGEDPDSPEFVHIAGFDGGISIGGDRHGRALGRVAGCTRAHQFASLLGPRTVGAREDPHLPVVAVVSSASARRGSDPRARATRTFSRAAPGSSPTRQASQSAHERKPVFQPLRASNSRTSARSRAVAASR